MDVIGYSERGAVNSLFYEIAYSSDASFLLVRACCERLSRTRIAAYQSVMPKC